jgi:subtilisin family serine protease
MHLPLRRSTIAILAACGSALAGLAAPAFASADPGQVIVRYAAGTDAAERADARADANVVRDEALPLPRTEVVTPEAGTSTGEAIADLERSPDVAYAEPDGTRRALVVPQDPGFALQWALQNTGQASPFDFRDVGTVGDDVDATGAWDLATEGTTVGIVDSGIDLDHPDLKANILPTGGRDFVDGDTVPRDEYGHGTHVAGIIGAVANNIGVAGVDWKARLLPIRVLGADGSGSVSNVVAGYQAAVASGARVVNLSLGGDSPSQTEYDAIRNAANVLFVVAAGNSHADDDTTDSFPCDYDLPNIVCVAATDRRDELASFSNYGARSVDLAAPGVDIISTLPRYPVPIDNFAPGRSYWWLDGTSMAAPFVSGAAALILQHEPELTPWQVRGMLTAGVDPVAGLAGKVASGGRLDIHGALTATPPDPASAPTPSEVATRRADATPIATTPSAPVATPPAPVPAPAPAPAAPVTTPAPVVPAVDRTAPTIGLSLAGRHALANLLAGRLRASTTASEAASIRLELRIDGATAKKLRLARRATATIIATATATLAGAGRTTVALRLTSAARRALRRARSVKVSLRATGTDAAGNSRTRTLAVTITR